MREIWKRKLSIKPDVLTGLPGETMELPHGFEVKHVGLFEGTPYFWLEIDTHAPIQTYQFWVIQPDWQIPPGAQYLGTIVFPEFKDDYGKARQRTLTWYYT